MESPPDFWMGGDARSGITGRRTKYSGNFSVRCCFSSSQPYFIHYIFSYTGNFSFTGINTAGNNQMGQYPDPDYTIPYEQQLQLVRKKLSLLSLEILENKYSKE